MAGAKFVTVTQNVSFKAFDPVFYAIFFLSLYFPPQREYNSPARIKSSVSLSAAVTQNTLDQGSHDCSSSNESSLKSPEQTINDYLVE